MKFLIAIGLILMSSIQIRALELDGFVAEAILTKGEIIAADPPLFYVRTERNFHVCEVKFKRNSKNEKYLDFICMDSTKQ